MKTKYRFNGAVYDRARDDARLGKQHERIRALMLDGCWRTLDEISRRTGDPQASISGQLRHYRKKRYGAFVVHKTLVPGTTGLWAYRLVVTPSARRYLARIYRRRPTAKRRRSLRLIKGGRK